MCKSMCILKVYIEIIQILKTFPSYKTDGSKNALFFLSRAHSFIFNFRFLYELKHKVRLSRLSLCGIFRFGFRFVFIKIHIFVQQNAWTL